MQNKKAAAENEAQSFDTSFQSSVFSQSPKAADAKEDDKRSSSSSNPKLFGKIQNFDQCEQKRPSQVKYIFLIPQSHHFNRILIHLDQIKLQMKNVI